MSRASSLVAAFTFVLLSIGTAGCEDDGLSLTVRLQSGLRAGVEVRFADVRLLRGFSRCEAGAEVFRTFGRVLETSDQGALVRGTLTLGAFEPLEPGVYTVRVRLLRPPASMTAPADSGAFFVERCVAITLTNDRVVRIPITADCVEVVCPAVGGDATFDQCLNGRCVDPRCVIDDASTATFCCDRSRLGDACEESPTLCAASADCTDGPGCAGPADCIDGACIEPLEDLCASGEHCDATEDRCVVDPVFSDAGMLDAPDAGPLPLGLVCDRCEEVACVGDSACVAVGDVTGDLTCLTTCTEAEPTCPRGFSCLPVGAALACVPLGACCVDEDGDGFGAGSGCLGPDCDDTDDARNAGRLELCNGVDDDCDGTPDDPPTECGGGSCGAEGASFSETGGDSCSAGTCTPSDMTTPCGLFTCDGGGDSGDQCARSCMAVGGDDDRLCVVSAHCDDGACEADTGSGGGCDESSDCTTSACDGGVCCEPGVGECLCPGGPTETVCGDGGDSDCDMLVDCADSDCTGSSCGAGGRTCVGSACVCPGGATETACADGTDDDCDAQIDCADADCAGQGCGTGRLCIGGACACGGGTVETACDDSSDDDCDGLIDCLDPDCFRQSCGGSNLCCGTTCSSSSPMYTSTGVGALMCSTTLGGSSYAGLCSFTLFYDSACGPLDLSSYAPGWEHAPSSPAGCDYNDCTGTSCQQNFCIPCPSGDCTACPGSPSVTSC